MKKFGTPIGAAPGSAKEKVGFDGVGSPDGVVGGAGLTGVVVGFVAVVGVVEVLGFAFLPAGPDPEEWCWEGDDPLPGRLGFAGVVLVVVVVVVVLGGGWVWVEEVVLVLVLVVVPTGAGDVEVVEVVGGGHDSDTLFAGPGRFSDDSGAPGASWK